MKRFKLLLCGLVCGLGLVSGAPPANAGMIFTTHFDNTSDRTLSLPYVGSGVLSFDNDLLDGTYAWSTLTNPAFSFAVGGASFSLADITTSTAALGLTIYQSGTDWYFDGPAAGSFTGGVVDFENSNGALASFEPTDLEPPFDAPPFNRYGVVTSLDALDAGDGFFGTYGVHPTAVPEPGTLTLLAMGGLLVCMLGAWRRRRATAS
jgi:hypothetical protein